jgi:2-dehydro-3-deoxygluconokinase
MLRLSPATVSTLEETQQLQVKIIDHVKKHEKLISFDVNYRSKLWAPAKAKKILTQIVEKVDILICSLNDAATVFGYKSTDAGEIANGLLHQFRNRLVVLTLADKGALAYDGRNFGYQDAYQAANVDRIGRGDSFCAGFLYGYLTDSVQAGLKYGNAMAALNQTFKGDFFWGGKQEVDRLIAGNSKILDR